MGFLKARTNKKYGYAPRYYEGSATPFKLEPKFDKYRKATVETKGLKNKFNSAVDDFKHNPDRGANRITIIIISILILIFLFIIDFDLSIFSIPS